MKKTAVALLACGLAFAPPALLNARIAAAEARTAPSRKENGKTFFVSAPQLGSASPDSSNGGWRKIGGGLQTFSEAYDFFKSQIGRLSELDTARLRLLAISGAKDSVQIWSYPDSTQVACLEISIDSLIIEGCREANLEFSRLDGARFGLTRGQALAMKGVLDKRSLLVAKSKPAGLLGVSEYSIGSGTAFNLYLALSAWCCDAGLFDIALSCFDEVIQSRNKSPEKRITTDPKVREAMYPVYREMMTSYLYSAMISGYSVAEIVPVVLSASRTAQEMQDYELAIQLLSEAVEIDPKNPELYRERAAAFRAFGKQRELGGEASGPCNEAAKQDEKAAKRLSK